MFHTTTALKHALVPPASLQRDAFGATGCPPASDLARPRVRSKFLCVGDEKLYVRGVTYGPFRPRGPLDEHYDRDEAAADFASMAAEGVNAVRVYTVPPGWLLDLAACHGLRVLVGLPWEQHVAV